MSVVVVGIEHQQAPLDLLERVAMSGATVTKVLGAVHSWDNVQETVVLSTCLRTEIYAVVDRFHEAVEDVWELFATHAGMPAETIQEHTSIRFDDDVAQHLFSVASGLESAVLGESEILGQVRRAWERARDERASGPMLSELFRGAVQAGKRVRSETGIARGTTSFSHAAIELVEQRRDGGLRGADVAVLGAGEMGGGVVMALEGLPDGRRPARVVIANRSLERARKLAEAVAPVLDARTVGMEDLSRTVAGAQVVFTAVESGGHLLTVGQLADAVVGREDEVLVIDLGMPRNVEPAAASIPGVTLLDMDDLRVAVTQAINERRSEAERAAEIVSEELARYREATRERGAAPVISALRSRMEELRVAELERRRAQIGSDGSKWTEVDAVTKAVLAKLLHDPMVVLRESAGTARGERLVEALRALFDL